MHPEQVTPDEPVPSSRSVGRLLLTLFVVIVGFFFLAVVVSVVMVGRAFRAVFFARNESDLNQPPAGAASFVRRPLVSTPGRRGAPARVALQEMQGGRASDSSP